jgi:predicted nucleic acid-binding Zn ribbon protein
MGSRKLETVPDALLRLVRTLDIERKLLAHAVEPAWPRAVGPRLAAHTRAARLQDGVLTIEARSASWLNEVSLRRETVLARLREEMPQSSIRELRFRLGGGFPALDGQPLRRPLETTPEEVERARTQLAAEGTTGAEIVARAFALQRKQRR